MKDWKAVLFVFLGACCYGVLSTLVKLAYEQGFHPGGVTGSQMMFGVIFLFALTLVKRKWTKLTIRQWLMILLAGMFVGLTGIFYYTSLSYIPASLAIVLLFQFTWIGVLLESILNRKWPSVQKGMALIFLFLGTLCASNIWGTDSRGDLPLWGIVIGLLAAVTYSGFIISSGRLAVEINPWMRSLVMSMGSLVIVFMVFPPVFLLDGSLGQGLWKWGTLLAVLGIVLPNLLFTYGVPQIGGSLATILGSAELPMAVFMSWIVLGEPVTMWQWMGVTIILLGILVAEAPMKKRAWRLQ